MTQPHASKIDYLAHSKELIGRPGRVLNVVTGCKHGCEWCYARQMVEHGRLKGHPSYPYGFEPTFHVDRVGAVGPRSKWLIFLNDMGDCGCDCDFRDAEYPAARWDSLYIATAMNFFAELNPQHIILLLTKNPSWYALAEWPENVWCGKTATNNHELHSGPIMPDRFWLSLEPWLDKNAPNLSGCAGWTVIGGLSGKNPQPVSNATQVWLANNHDGGPFEGRRFVKANAGWHGSLRQYPDEWRVT